MNDFLDILVRVGSTPMSWGVLALMAAWAMVSVVKYVRCPLVGGRATISPADAETALQRRVRHPLAYLLAMLVGMGLAIAGLFGLAETESKGTLAFFFLAIGLYVILTMPVRLEIKDAEMRVVAAGSQEARSISTQGLRHTHRRLLQYEFGIVALFAAIVLLF